MFSPDKRIQSENFFIYPDEEIAKKLENLNASKNCIILMHELPIADYCKKTRKVIEKIQPLLVMGGHNHQIAKKEFIINGIKYLASSMKGESIQINI